MGAGRVRARCQQALLVEIGRAPPSEMTVEVAPLELEHELRIHAQLDRTPSNAQPPLEPILVVRTEHQLHETRRQPTGRA